MRDEETRIGGADCDGHGGGIRSVDRNRRDLRNRSGRRPFKGDGDAASFGRNGGSFCRFIPDPFSDPPPGGLRAAFGRCFIGFPVAASGVPPGSRKRTLSMRPGGDGPDLPWPFGPETSAGPGASCDLDGFADLRLRAYDLFVLCDVPFGRRRDRQYESRGRHPFSGRRISMGSEP